MSSPLEILRLYWGYDEFRHPQEEIIASVLSNNDTVALLPTGGGKSICFQIPALINNGICIVISPLIALMNDQVKNLKERNIKAIALTSNLSQDEIVTSFDNLKFGNYKFLYLSPEKLQSEFIQQKISQLDVQLIAIDEAHCISEWGHDFRPSYLNINTLRVLFPDTPMIALTASATEKVLKDIIENLGFESPNVFKKSFYRENLAYQIFEVEDKLFKVEQILKKIKGSKIIYTNTRRNTIEISQQLNYLGFKTNFYHGGMSMDEKMNAFDNWLTEKTPVIVATNAFGMGIDKSNVRAVVHINIPQSIENYIQEAGRGGRDSRKAFSVVLKNKSDIYNAQNRLEKTLATVDYIKKVLFNLSQYFQISYGEHTDRNYDFNLSEFCAKYHFSVVITYNALKILDSENIISLDENFNRKSNVKFIARSQEIFDYCDKNPSKKALVNLLLRTYGGVFESPKKINENYLSTSVNISKSILKNNLKTLHQDGIIRYYETNNNTQIQFLVPREDDRTINVIAQNIKQRNLLKTEKLKNIIDFIENDTLCRSRQLLSYFNEIATSDCGICDVCISKKKSETQDYTQISTSIVKLMKEKSLSSREIVVSIKASEKDILFCLQLLLEKNILAVTSQNKYMLV